LVEPIAMPCMIVMDLLREFNIIIKHRTGPVRVHARNSDGRQRNIFHQFDVQVTVHRDKFL